MAVILLPCGYQGEQAFLPPVLEAKPSFSEASNDSEGGSAYGWLNLPLQL